MRILSTGDWHYNAGYDEDVNASVCQIIKYVEANPVDIVCITGDVYERASEPGSRNIAAECIQALAELVPVFIVRGNHDAPGDLLVLSRLKSKNAIVVYEDPHTVCSVHLAFHFMPWLTKARWQSFHPGASKEEGDKTVSQLVLQYLRNEIDLDPDRKHILVAHLTIAGAMAQNHQQMGADGITLGLYDLKEAGFYSAILGHIHLKQNIASPLYFYNGSVSDLEYGEYPDKFFSILDTETDEVKWIKLNTIHRQDVNAHWINGAVELDITQDNLEILKGARVRVSLKVDGGDNLEVAKKSLYHWLESVGALEYKINPQVITATQVRAVEISKAESLSQKLDQWWIATSEPDESTKQDMKDKLSELEEALCSQSS